MEKPDADASEKLSSVSFKKVYDEIIEKTFKQIPSARKDRQELIYNNCKENNGFINPITGNTKIREELARDVINSIDKVAEELTNFLWNIIEKIIDWANKRLFNLPEIRSEIIGVDENIEKSLLRKAFATLIQRLAIQDIFLKPPRVREIRLHVLREYQIEVKMLDDFIKNKTKESTGIISFIENGKSKIDISNEEREVKKNDPKKKEVKDKKNHTSSKKVINSVKSKEENGQDFNGVCLEIGEDFKMFLSCMKHAVFYTSGILRFHNEVLDKYRLKFIELEEQKHRWYSLVCKTGEKLEIKNYFNLNYIYS